MFADTASGLLGMTSTVTPGLPDSVNAVPDKENWSPLPQEIKLSEIRDKVKYFGQKKKKNPII